MIDTGREIAYSVDSLQKKLPVRRSSATIRRWITEGYKPRGNRAKAIKMEFVVIGGCMFSSVEAYHRWVDACTRAKQGE